MVENRTNSRPLKRARRSARVTADLPDFIAFPPPAVGSVKPFRVAVRSFLSNNARLTVAFPPPVLPCLMTWQILFRVGDLMSDGPDLAPVVVALDVVEEDVTRSTRSVYCDQCRVVGWSGHPVCRKRYHFMIRSENGGGMDGYYKSCSSCGNPLQFSDSRCKWCNQSIATDDFEDWVYSQFEDNTHMLHGVVHSNGYGHLLTVNGREGGSNVLSGSDIMNFWDRLCTALSVRKVSVMDVSKKYGMEYRLLHAITKGSSWYANWGYEFGFGSYGLTVDAYKRAEHTLSSMPLSPLLYQGRKPQTRLQKIITFYQALSGSELLTLKDLFSFLLRLINESHKKLITKASKKSNPSPSNVLCAWTRDDVEHVQQAMIKVLMAANQSSWVTRRTLKGVMCKTASLELLDYCLKHLGGKLAANGMVVEAQCNPTSSDFEFRLQPLNFTSCQSSPHCNFPSEEHLKGDLKYLFDVLLNPKSMMDYRPQATRDCVIDSATKLLDCKQFVKDCKPHADDTSTIYLWCHLELADQSKDDPIPPPELIVLPLNATVADLKSEAAKAFEEVYAMFKRLQVEDLLGYGPIEDNITLKLLVGTSGLVKVRGRCSGKYGLNRFRKERGTENWTVDCTCGTKDDDGERMLACDVCGVWQHTRCAGIDNSDAIPAKYICKKCSNSFNS
ncbi:hypothetical protein SLA2020_464280 [Shorea laevis]